MKKLQKIAGLFALLVVALLTGCASLVPRPFPTQPEIPAWVEEQAEGRQLSDFDIVFDRGNVKYFTYSRKDLMEDRAYRPGAPFGFGSFHELAGQPSPLVLRHQEVWLNSLSTALRKKGLLVVDSCRDTSRCLIVKSLVGYFDFTDQPSADVTKDAAKVVFAYQAEFVWRGAPVAMTRDRVIQVTTSVVTLDTALASENVLEKAAKEFFAVWEERFGANSVADHKKREHAE